jgi:hypothetical protein
MVRFQSDRSIVRSGLDTLDIMICLVLGCMRTNREKYLMYIVENRKENLKAQSVALTDCDFSENKKTKKINNKNKVKIFDRISRLQFTRKYV